MIRSFIAILALCMSTTAAYANTLEFDVSDTESCLQIESEHLSPLTCIGKSANSCMENSAGGFSTVGMGGCFDLELQYWDGRLNAAYGKLRTQMRAYDAAIDGSASSAPRQWPALKAMQRAWITYRDATCDLERSFWGGGTGGGPATVSCLMVETGEQTLTLERMINTGN